MRTMRCRQLLSPDKPVQQPETFVNCGRKHIKRSSDCNVWKTKEVMKIKVTQRLTYSEARNVYEPQTPELTFSKIVQSMPAI